MVPPIAVPFCLPPPPSGVCYLKAPSPGRSSRTWWVASAQGAGAGGCRGLDMCEGEAAAGGGGYLAMPAIIKNCGAVW